MRRLFDRFRALVRQCGPVRIYAQKTGIVFQVRVRFAGAKTRKDWIEAMLWLTRKAKHPRLLRILSPYPNAHVHLFRIESLADLDAEFAALVRESYRVGRQEHVRR